MPESYPNLRVWIDQDLCTGDGLCSEIAPDVFISRDDGLWVVQEKARFFGKDILFDGGVGEGHGPEGGRGLARIPDDQLDIVIEAAEDCPGSCIFIESLPE